MEKSLTEHKESRGYAETRDKPRPLSTSVPGKLLIDLKIVAARKVTSLQTEVQQALRSHVEREQRRLDREQQQLTA